MADMKITRLPDGSDRIEFADGHVGIGQIEFDEEDRNKMRFTGYFACGLHGPNGEHLPTPVEPLSLAP